MRQHYADKHADTAGSMDSVGGFSEFLREMDSFSGTINAAQENLKALAEELKQGIQLVSTVSASFAWEPSSLMGFSTRCGGIGTCGSHARNSSTSVAWVQPRARQRELIAAGVGSGRARRLLTLPALLQVPNLSSRPRGCEVKMRGAGKTGGVSIMAWHHSKIRDGNLKSKSGALG
jgi:hypothetical protein